MEGQILAVLTSSQLLTIFCPCVSTCGLPHSAIGHFPQVQGWAWIKSTGYGLRWLVSFLIFFWRIAGYRPMFGQFLEC